MEIIIIVAICWILYAIFKDPTEFDKSKESQKISEKQPKSGLSKRLGNMERNLNKFSENCEAFNVAVERYADETKKSSIVAIANTDNKIYLATQVSTIEHQIQMAKIRLNYKSKGFGVESFDEATLEAEKVVARVYDESEASSKQYILEMPLIKNCDSYNLREKVKLAELAKLQLSESLDTHNQFLLTSFKMLQREKEIMEQLEFLYPDFKSIFVRRRIVNNRIVDEPIFGDESVLRLTRNLNNDNNLVLTKYGVHTLFHMTHYSNVENIITNGLCSHNNAKDTTQQRIDDVEVNNRRNKNGRVTV